MNDPIRHPAIVAPAPADLAALAAQINAEHDACEQSLRAGVQHALQAGRLLRQAKAGVGHGKWLPWLKANVRVSQRTAQEYMKLAKDWPTIEGKAQRVADLSYREVMQLLRSAGREEQPSAASLPASAALPALENANGLLASVPPADGPCVADDVGATVDHATDLARFELAELRQRLDAATGSDEQTFRVVAEIRDRAARLMSSLAEIKLREERVLGQLLAGGLDDSLKNLGKSLQGMGQSMSRVKDVLTPEQFASWLASQGVRPEDADAYMTAAASDSPAITFLEMADEGAMMRLAERGFAHGEEGAQVERLRQGEQGR